MIPGGIIEQPAPLHGVERDARLPGLQEADPRRHGVEDVKDKTVRVRVCKNDGCGQEIDR